MTQGEILFWRMAQAQGTRGAWSHMRRTCSRTSKNTCDTCGTNGGLEAVPTMTQTGNDDAKTHRQLPYHPPVGVACEERSIDAQSAGVGRRVAVAFRHKVPRQTSRALPTPRVSYQSHLSHQNASNEISHVENGPAVRTNVIHHGLYKGPQDVQQSRGSRVVCHHQTHHPATPVTHPMSGLALARRKSVAALVPGRGSLSQGGRHLLKSTRRPCVRGHTCGTATTDVTTQKSEGHQGRPNAVSHDPIGHRGHAHHASAKAMFESVFFARIKTK